MRRGQTVAFGLTYLEQTFACLDDGSMGDCLDKCLPRAVGWLVSNFIFDFVLLALMFVVSLPFWAHVFDLCVCVCVCVCVSCASRPVPLRGIRCPRRQVPRVLQQQRLQTTPRSWCSLPGGAQAKAQRTWPVKESCKIDSSLCFDLVPLPR